MGTDASERAARGGGRSKQTVYFPADTKAGAKITGSLSDALGKLAQDIQTQALRSAAHAGAKLLHDELKVRAPVGPTHNLRNAVYRYHDEKKSTPTKQVYAVGVNKGKAPHWFNVEYGHWRVNVVIRLPNGTFMATKQRLPQKLWVAAVPYLRPTEARMGDAVRAMKRRLVERVRELLSGPKQ